MAISETRPPITAGPIERAFKFLKSTSVRVGVVALGDGLVADDNAGAVLSGDGVGEVALSGATLGEEVASGLRAESS